MIEITLNRECFLMKRTSITLITTGGRNTITIKPIILIILKTSKSMEKIIKDIKRLNNTLNKIHIRLDRQSKNGVDNA